MNASDALGQLRNPAALIVTALLALTVLILIARRIRKVATSERPDEPLSNWAMLTGFGWSSEAVWVLTGPGGAELPTPIRISLFCIFEVILVVFMIRAKRNVKTLGHPGRAGRNAWLVATGMSLVAVWTAHNPGEAFLRVLVPVLLTAMWWDGLVGEGVRKTAGASTWRWTPRRFLLALGAIEPGERDIETVHRERLTRQMTRLYFKVRHGSPRFSEFRKGRLARFGLVADDEIIVAVRERVDRATWFDLKQPAVVGPASRPAVPAGRAVSRRAARVIHNRRLRTVRVKHLPDRVSAVQEPEPDPRLKQEVDDVIRFIAAARPDLPQRQIAQMARTSPATVNRVLRRKQNPAPPPRVNGERPNLEGADRP